MIDAEWKWRRRKYAVSAWAILNWWYLLHTSGTSSHCQIKSVTYSVCLPRNWIKSCITSVMWSFKLAWRQKKGCNTLTSWPKTNTWTSWTSFQRKITFWMMPIQTSLLQKWVLRHLKCCLLAWIWMNFPIPYVTKQLPILHSSVRQKPWSVWRW